MNILDTNDQNDQIQIDPNKDYLEVLLGPGGKYDVTKFDGDRDAALKALARGKYEGDVHIDRLKDQNDKVVKDFMKFREDSASGPNLKEVLDQYMSEFKQSQSNNNTPVQEDKSVFDETKLNDMVKHHLTANKQLEREEANASSVESKLQEAYGPNYKQIVKQQIDDLGMSVDFFNNLARQNPKVLYKTLGVDQPRQENFQAPPMSSQRTNLNSNTGSAKTWSQWEKLRKTDPRSYWEPQTQQQLFRDHSTLGTRFEDGDFNKR
jgi:hypothetical protein